MIKEIFSHKLKHAAKYLMSSEFREISRINSLSRYTNFNTHILGNLVTGIDGPSFVFTYHEIFKKEIYRFNSSIKNPFIVDCGANIGLSIIYFKQLFPEAHILAFEPDKKIFNVLADNIKSFNLRSVELENKAVWDTETTLDFYSEGADGGRIIQSEEKNNIISVSAVRLQNYLNGPKINLLKIDIEGAETAVLRDCRDNLHNVEKIMVEYHSFVGKPQTLHEIIEILCTAGFRIYALPVGNSPQPFVARSAYLGIDMQFNIFGYREH